SPTASARSRKPIILLYLTRAALQSRELIRSFINNRAFTGGSLRCKRSMNESRLRVDIALCTFNGEKFIREQLDSILTQDYPHIRLIIVDDCSSDSSWSILEEYAARFPVIRIYRNDQNIGYIRN